MVATSNSHLGELVEDTPDFTVTADGKCASCGVETENCANRVLWCPECGLSSPLF